MTYRRKDAHYRRAQREGYRARSAYKLVELDRRFAILRKGDHVADLGSWPGGWLQVTLERIGEKGRVVGLDLAGIVPLAAPNLGFVCGDVRDPAAIASVRERLGGRADVVLCDLAPKLTGVRATDEARVTELADATLTALHTLLRPGGRLLMKLLMGPQHEQVVADLRRAFAEVRTTRPAASRAGSSELYAVGTDYRAEEPPA